MRKLSILFTLLVMMCIPFLSYSESNLTAEDLEFIKFMQDSGGYPKDLNLDNVTHEKIVKAKGAFKELYGIDYETIKNPPPPDQRFSSPEKTWNLYKKSLITGNLDSVQSCLSYDFARKHTKLLEALGHDKMKEIAEKMHPIEQIKQDEKTAKYRIKRTQEYEGKIMDITYYIYFVKVLGNWKIAQY